MIDIHCHILPGLDDGPENLQETLDMCRMAVDQGITTVFATPHMFNGLFSTSRESILNAYVKTREALESEGIPLNLYVGADLHLIPDMVEMIQTNQALTLNNSRYFLMELPSMVLPPKLNEVVQRMIGSSLVPVITHPERNQVILKREEILLDLLDQGALCQVTAMSLTGEFGKDCERFACRMIEADAVHFIASDAHSTGWRRPDLSPAVRAAGQIIGETGAMRLVKDYPEAVLRCQSIDPVPAKRLPKPKRFWFF